MQRHIPVIIIVAALISLAAYFGPPLYRGMLFRRDCNRMLADAAAGKLPGVIAALDPKQRTAIGALLGQYLPPDYSQSIDSLKLSHYEETEPANIWAYVVAKIEMEGGVGIYEGRLHWTYDSKHWYWDFEGSYGAAFSAGAEQQEWIKLSDLVALAGQL